MEKAKQQNSTLNPCPSPIRPSVLLGTEALFLNQSPVHPQHLHHLQHLTHISPHSCAYLLSFALPVRHSNKSNHLFSFACMWSVGWLASSRG